MEHISLYRMFRAASSHIRVRSQWTRGSRTEPTRVVDNSTVVRSARTDNSAPPIQTSDKKDTLVRDEHNQAILSNTTSPSMNVENNLTSVHDLEEEILKLFSDRDKMSTENKTSEVNVLAGGTTAKPEYTSATTAAEFRELMNRVPKTAEKSVTSGGPPCGSRTSTDDKEVKKGALLPFVTKLPTMRQQGVPPQAGFASATKKATELLSAEEMKTDPMMEDETTKLEKDVVEEGCTITSRDEFHELLKLLLVALEKATASPSCVSHTSNEEKEVRKSANFPFVRKLSTLRPQSEPPEADIASATEKEVETDPKIKYGNTQLGECIFESDHTSTTKDAQFKELMKLVSKALAMSVTSQPCVSSRTSTDGKEVKTGAHLSVVRKLSTMPPQCAHNALPPHAGFASETVEATELLSKEGKTASMMVDAKTKLGKSVDEESTTSDVQFNEFMKKLLKMLRSSGSTPYVSHTSTYDKEVRKGAHLSFVRKLSTLRQLSVLPQTGLTSASEEPTEMLSKEMKTVPTMKDSTMKLSTLRPLSVRPQTGIASTREPTTETSPMTEDAKTKLGKGVEEATKTLMMKRIRDGSLANVPHLDIVKQGENNSIDFPSNENSLVDTRTPSDDATSTKTDASTNTASRQFASAQEFLKYQTVSTSVMPAAEVGQRTETEMKACAVVTQKGTLRDAKTLIEFNKSKCAPRSLMSLKECVEYQHIDYKTMALLQKYRALKLREIDYHHAQIKKHRKQLLELMFKTPYQKPQDPSKPP